jgi:hypothetical protein
MPGARSQSKRSTQGLCQCSVLPSFQKCAWTSTSKKRAKYANLPRSFQPHCFGHERREITFSYNMSKFFVPLGHVLIGIANPAQLNHLDWYR